MKYHMLNLRLNDVEWGFLQSLKLKGVAMSEYIRTTMKTTPRYQDYIKVLYGNHKDEYLQSLPAENKKPSLPTDQWNSVNVERDIMRDVLGDDGLTVTDVLGSKHNKKTTSHKLVQGDVNSNRVNNPKKAEEKISTIGEDIPIQKSKIDTRYE